MQPIRQPRDSSERGNVDDRARFLGLHRRDYRLATAPDAVDIDIHAVVPIELRQIVEAPAVERTL